MADELPIVGKKYSWKHAPQHFSLVVGFLNGKVIEVWDCNIVEGNDEETLGNCQLTDVEGFIFNTNLKEFTNDK